MKRTTKVNLSGVGKTKGPKKTVVATNKQIAQSFIRNRKMSKGMRRKVKNVAIAFLGITVLSGLLGGLWFFSYLQQLNEDLPSLSDPFKAKELASIVYDRTGGVELTRFIGDYARDPVVLDDIPDKIRWAFLAAEDIDFYTHQGFDPAAILRCTAQFVTSGGQDTCGGSTITQQVVKITVLGPEVKIERKLKEMLMAIKIEQAYSKDEILQLYLTVAPFGGNIYGITTAADFYFGKKVDELTLAEGAILASIVQNPVMFSPTKGYPDNETSQAAVKWRQENVVLNQLRKNLNKINTQNRANYNDFEMEDVITEDMIDEALTQELKYEPPILAQKRAGHFIDYVQKLLTTRNYKYGEEPFTDTELLNGGYRITTTLDWKLQQFGERTVQNAMKTYGRPYLANNAALILMQPGSGEILVMVGSKDYNAKSSGCNKNGTECLFDPQVNILDSRQSPGSSTKPFGFYEAYRMGIMHTATFLPDIPIDVAGYNIKNWNGSYFGVSPKTFAGQMLQDSRNLPSIIVVNAIGGAEKFAQVMQTFGYTTYNKVDRFGPSVILGGADVIPVEHAQGYGVLANGGDLVQNEAILRIEDSEGNIVYEHEAVKQRVADPKAVFMTNQSILNTYGSSWDGRDVGGKSGTSQDSRDIWMSIYSPDFVALAWMGNNNNRPMRIDAFGANLVQPWLEGFLRQIGNTKYLKPATDFKRPAGVSRVDTCALSNKTCTGSFSGIAGGWLINKFDYAPDNIRIPIRVCKNQVNRLARPIDEYFDNAKDSVGVTYLMPYAPSMQKYLDRFLNRKYPGNGGPSKYCTVDYSGQGVDGVWVHTTNVPSGTVISNNPTVSGQVFTTKIEGVPTVVDIYFAGALVVDDLPINADGTFSTTLNLPATVYENGTYSMTFTAFDSLGTTSSKTTSVVLGSESTSRMILNTVTNPVSLPAAAPYTYQLELPYGVNGVINTSMTYTGVATPLSQIQRCYRINGSAFTCGTGSSFTIPFIQGGVSYDVDYYYTATTANGGKIRSGTIKILVTEGDSP